VAKWLNKLTSRSMQFSFRSLLDLTFSDIWRSFSCRCTRWDIFDIELAVNHYAFVET